MEIDMMLMSQYSQLLDYKKELFYLLCLCTMIYAVFKYYVNLSYKTAHTTKSITYQTKTMLTNFKTKAKKLSENNAIYLTQFKYDGTKAYILHILYSYYVYFSDPINLFCLVISIGQVYEYFDFRSVLPLSIFANIAMISHMYSTSLLLKQQDEINLKQIKKLNSFDGSDKAIMQRELKRGDFIKLTDLDEIPADILLINSRVSVQELELTGEDIIISKTGVHVADFNKCEITVNHLNNNGFVGGKIYDSKNIIFKGKNYDSKNIIFRGTKIVDGTGFGIVIETGNDCQIFQIDNNIQKEKTSLQKKIIDICLLNLYFMLIITSFSSVIIYAKSISEGYSYKRLWKIIRKMILLFNSMVPLSLQFFFNAASILLSKRIEKKNNVSVNRNGITAFQINPEYIVSDKTGTITTGQMDIIGIFTEDIKRNFINLVKNDQIKEEHILNVVACTEIQPHSVTKKLLKNDPLEEKILSHFFDKYNSKLLLNSDELIQLQNIGEFKKLYYKPFDYKLEVKMGVLRENKKIILHVQGTPESINTYSGGKITNILKKIESEQVKKNIYKRIIAHASKEISEHELELLKSNPELVLNNMSNCVVYVFYDYVVDGVSKSIKMLQDSKKDFTLLTGDKMSSAVEIGKTIDIIEDNKIIVFDKLQDLLCRELDTEKYCFVINGRLLEQMDKEHSFIDQFIKVIKMTNRRIIYRASPNGKQKFVSMLQKYLRQEVMMIGDGANDVSAIIQSNIGVGVKNDNNNNVQNISEIVISNWNIIPNLLTDVREKQLIITNISRWILMKHMMTAFMLLSMLVMSKFETIRDPASPYLMAVLNGFMFVCMCVYTWYDEPVNVHRYLSFKKMIVRGIIIGLINGIITFSIYDIDDAICILVGLQAVELIVQLYWKYSKTNWIINSTNFVMIAIWLKFIFLYLW